MKRTAKAIDLNDIFGDFSVTAAAFISTLAKQSCALKLLYDIVF